MIYVSHAFFLCSSGNVRGTLTQDPRVGQLEVGHRHVEYMVDRHRVT